MSFEVFSHCFLYNCARDLMFPLKVGFLWSLCFAHSDFWISNSAKLLPFHCQCPCCSLNPCDHLQVYEYKSGIVVFCICVELLSETVINRPGVGVWVSKDDGLQCLASDWLHKPSQASIACMVEFSCQMWKRKLIQTVYKCTSVLEVFWMVCHQHCVFQLHELEVSCFSRN